MSLTHKTFCSGRRNPFLLSHASFREHRGSLWDCKYLKNIFFSQQFCENSRFSCYIRAKTDPKLFYDDYFSGVPGVAGDRIFHVWTLSGTARRHRPGGPDALQPPLRRRGLRAPAEVAHFPDPTAQHCGARPDFRRRARCGLRAGGVSVDHLRRHLHGCGA